MVSFAPLFRIIIAYRSSSQPPQWTPPQAFAKGGALVRVVFFFDEKATPDYCLCVWYHISPKEKEQLCSAILSRKRTKYTSKDGYQQSKRE